MSTNADLRTKFHEAVSQGSKAPWVDTPPGASFSRSSRIPAPPGILGGGVATGPAHSNFQSFPPGFAQLQPQQFAPPPAPTTNVELTHNATPADTNAVPESKNSRLYMYILGFVILLVLIGLAYWGYRKWCDSKKPSVLAQGGAPGNYRGDPSGAMGPGRFGGMKQPPQISAPPPADAPQMVTQFRDMPRGPGGAPSPSPPAVAQPPQPEDNDPNFTPLSQAAPS